MQSRHIEACLDEIALLTANGWGTLPRRALYNSIRSHDLLWSSPELQIDIDQVLQSQTKATNIAPHDSKKNITESEKSHVVPEQQVHNRTFIQLLKIDIDKALQSLTDEANLIPNDLDNYIPDDTTEYRSILRNLTYHDQNLTLPHMLQKP